MNFVPELEYRVATGELYEDGVLVGFGYAGHGEGRNNPDLEGVRLVGPLPRGEYMIGPAYYSQKTGPMTLPLSQVSGESFGRAGFRIHGDNAARDASEGCIVLARILREGLSRYREKHPRVRLRVT